MFMCLFSVEISGSFLTSAEHRRKSQGLQSRPPVTGVLKWEILESALGSAPEGAPGNRGAPGGAPESAQGDWGCSRECSRECSSCGALTGRALSGEPPISLSTFGSTLRSTSKSTFKDFPL